MSTAPSSHRRVANSESVPAVARSVTASVSDGQQNVNVLMAEAEARLRIADPAGVEEMLDDVSQRAEADPRMQARVMSARAMLEYLRKRFDRSFEASRQASESWTALGDLGEAASARAMGARTLLSVGSAEDALTEALACWEDASRDGDTRSILNTTTALGHVYYAMQRFDEALACFERALQLARTLGDLVGEGAMLDAVACVYGCQASTPAFQDDRTARESLLAKALRLWEQARSIARQTRHRRNLAAVIANEAEALVLLGRPEAALTLLQFWKLDPAVDLPSVIWHLRDTEGVVLMRLGRHDEAIVTLTDALPFADTGVQKMSAHGHLSEAFELAGDAVSALAHHKSFHASYKVVASEAAQRSASVAAVRLGFRQANAMAVEQRDRAERLAISNDQLSQRANHLMQLSLEDPLTGLANRRMMEKLLGSDAHGFAFAMLDVDHFKRINDDWSHAVGDEVLKQLATLMLRCCRASDTPVRCGGEEFAILLRPVNAEGTVRAAERLRSTIEAFDWTSIAPGLAVTVSIGVAFASEAETADLAMRLADRRLYAAKHAGRNRVVGPGDPIE